MEQIVLPIINNWPKHSVKKLFFISARGCDDTTIGLAKMNYNEFINFNSIRENLNENSSYGCMPTIDIEETKMEYFRKYHELTYEEKEHICDHDIFYLEGEQYTFKEGFDRYNINIHAGMRSYKIDPLDILNNTLKF